MVLVFQKGATRLLLELRLSVVLRSPGKGWIGVAMGAFDKPTGTKLRVHIFVGDKGDYYDIADGLPQNAQ